MVTPYLPFPPSLSGGRESKKITTMHGLFLCGLEKDLNGKYCREIAGVWMLFFKYHLDSAHGRKSFII